MVHEYWKYSANIKTGKNRKKDLPFAVTVVSFVNWPLSLQLHVPGIPSSPGSPGSPDCPG